MSNTQTMRIAKALAEEREACAEIADYHGGLSGCMIAAAICTRSEAKEDGSS